MDEYERYFFDLNGYLVIQDALTPEQVGACNEAIDHNRDHIRDEKSEVMSDALVGDKPRGQLEEMLTWPKPWCQPFRDLIDNLTVTPTSPKCSAPNFSWTIYMESP